MPSIEFSIGTKPRSTSPASTARSTSGIDGSRHQLGLGEVGLGQQRLLGERAERPEEADARAAGDACRVSGHGLAG